VRGDFRGSASFLRSSTRSPRSARCASSPTCRRSVSRLAWRAWRCPSSVRSLSHQWCWRSDSRFGAPRSRAINRNNERGSGIARIDENPWEVRSCSSWCSPSRGDESADPLRALSREDVDDCVATAACDKPAIDRESDHRLLVRVQRPARVLRWRIGLSDAEQVGQSPKHDAPGCEVLIAADADEAVATLRNRLPEVVVADLRLPQGGSGRDAIERVCAATGRRIPALTITGDTAAETLSQTHRYGYPLLHKPLRPVQLRAALSQLLAETAERSPAAGDCV